MLPHQPTQKPKETWSPHRMVDGILFPQSSLHPLPYKKQLTQKSHKNDRKPHAHHQKQKTPRRASKLALAGIIVFFLSVVPIHLLETTQSFSAQAESSAQTLGLLYASIQSKDYAKAETAIYGAQKTLQSMLDNINMLGQRNIFLSRFLPLQDSSITYENLLDILSTATTIGVDIVDDLMTLSTASLTDLNDPAASSVFFETLDRLHDKLVANEDAFRSMNEKIESIDTSLVSQHEKPYIEALKNNVADIHRYYTLALTVTEELPLILGRGFDKKYLLLLQNNTEMRPTGGFIGSYGILTMRDGRIKNVAIDSIYNPDGQNDTPDMPPRPLSKITDTLGMRDANWDPDFPTSAQTIIGLYEKEGGFTPDGVLAIDTQVILNLLSLLPPIPMQEYNTIITRDNFIDVVQYKTSIDYDRSIGNPKQLLDDLAPLLLDSVNDLSHSNPKGLYELLMKNIREKHIQFFSRDADVQYLAQSVSMDGSLKYMPSDYFAYINANIGGMKTSDEIQESLRHTVAIQDDGTIVRTVRLSRTHTGTGAWPSGTNFSYLRFYVPKGSKVLVAHNLEKDDAILRNDIDGMLYVKDDRAQAKVQDLDLYVEHGKAVIGGWQVLHPGETVVTSITYELPFKINPKRPSDTYSLTIQKQAGITTQDTTVDIQTPRTYSVSKAAPTSYEIDDSIRFSSELAEDFSLTAEIARQ